MTRLDRELARVGTEARQVRRLSGTADALVDEGADLVLVEGRVESTAALALVAVLLDLEPVAVVGTEPGPGWADQVREVRRLVLHARPHLSDPTRLLAALDDPELTSLTDALGTLAGRETAVLLGDTVEALAAALLAGRRRGPKLHSAYSNAATPKPGRLLSAGRPAGPAGAAVLAALGLEPLLDLDLGGQAGRYVLALLDERARG